MSQNAEEGLKVILKLFPITAIIQLKKRPFAHSKFLHIRKSRTEESLESSNSHTCIWSSLYIEFFSLYHSSVIKHTSLGESPY